MTLRYDAPSGYTQRIPPGTAAFRKHVADLFGFKRTEVVRDRSRCNRQSSEHCVCRAIDFFTTDLKKGRKVFEWCVANAERYGIQSVIFNRRVWGFGRWYERHYSGASPHTDHVHVGLNIKGASSFPEEDPMTPAEKAEFDKLKQLVATLKKEVFTSGGRSRVDSLDQRVKKLEGKC